MAHFAMYAAIAGFIVLALSVGSACNAVLVGSVRLLFVRPVAPEPPHTANLANDVLVVISWFAWAALAMTTVKAYFGEGNTPLDRVAAGYFYIVLIMPLFLAAWLWLIAAATKREVANQRLMLSLGIAFLVAAGYGTINA